MLFNEIAPEISFFGGRINVNQNNIRKRSWQQQLVMRENVNIAARKQSN